MCTSLIDGDVVKFNIKCVPVGITIEKEVIEVLLPMVLQTATISFPHITPFIDFLHQLPPNTRVTLDQWDSFFLFNMKIPFDLSGYNEDDSCMLRNCVLCTVMYSYLSVLVLLH